jgi:pheromone shutdown protein TraB
MITLVGVGHVFVISQHIREIIYSRRPEVVCIELDPARYRALLEKVESAHVPIQYRLLGYIQKRMASKFGSEVGDEMLAAAKAAGEVGAKVALIDMDAGRVFAHLWKKMSFKEKMHLFGGAFLGLFMTKEKVEREMEKYESHEEEYIDVLSQGFPAVKEVLIDDRNKHMAKQISAIHAQHQNVVVVVGDGHVPGIVEALKPLDVETVRLKDLRRESTTAQTGSEYSSSFWYNSR